MSPRLGSPLKISHKMESLRHGSSKKLRKYTEKREDETKLIKDPAAKETKEDEVRGLFDGEDTPHGKDKASRLRSLDEDLMPLCKDSVMHRRGSSTFQTSGKLTRSRRLAKSSPELSNRKINLRLRADGSARESAVSTLAAGLSPASRSRITHPRLSVHDIDGSVLSHLQNTVKSEEKSKDYGKRRGGHSNHRCQNEGVSQPQSTPSSPVCSESANKAQIKQQKGRKSLNDITDAQQFTDRGRPSLMPKKQNLVHEAEVLKIEGKSCPQNERESQQDPRTATCDTLHPPQQGEKRNSLYDLQQILTLLQRDDLKRQTTSPAASASRNTNATSNASDKTSNASVYDLREFLMMAAAEKSSAGQMKMTTTSKLAASKTQTNASSHLLSPVQERENARDDRKGSVYDLMEFLSLGGNAGGETESGGTSENSSRAPSPRILLSPRGVVPSNDFLSVAKRGEEGRRSSTYDLLEFLSLSRSGTSSRSDSGQSSPALHVNEPSGPENEESELGRHKKENRSLSVYDLAEFLSMNSDVPPVVRVTPSDEEQTEHSAMDSGAGVKNDFHKPRGSVYDLREMLGVMQQEHETKRESTYNLEEMLSYFQREADGDESSQLASASAVMHSVNSHEKDTFSSPSPPKTASSGYSSASDTVPSTLSAKNLDTNDNNTRQMSVYDLREFLSLYAAQQIQSLPANQQLTTTVLRRKFSNISQSGVSIHVTDESNRSVADSEVCEDVFLPVPGVEAGPSDSSRKRSSIYDLREFLNILNADESPLRRRLSSVSSASSKSSESGSESSPNSTLKSDTNSAASNFGANENNTASRPQLSPRQDSGGSVSLYDLGEFLSLLNTDEAPLRRRLSSASDIIAAQGGDIRVRTPVLSRSDSEKGLYSLEEILTVMNDLEQKRLNENASGEFEADSGEEISIQVPTLPPKTDKTSAQSFCPRKRLQTQRSLNSVPETSEVKTSPLSNSF
ncbi:hypothetical protein OS493_025932 [Desmophyllum pertusum]|uniref:Uncharacterized protein n=1 Tax=Desmophyllum pertusum TaxID=174260 RepID=A0A9X0CKL2_9CNID|nr:hypothetical protein OS493_025932 [Desmophyllum pertusum]